MEELEYITCVNKDKSVPIFGVVDLGLVTDLVEDISSLKKSTSPLALDFYIIFSFKTVYSMI